MQPPKNTQTLNAQDILAQYGKMVSKLAYQFCGNREQAEDASQEAWAAVLKALPSYRGESEYSTWIYRIVVRTLLKHRRSEYQQSFAKLRATYVEADLKAPQHDDPHTSLWVKDTCSRCMIGVLHCLDSRSRMVYLLKQQCSFDYPQIAAALKISTLNARKIFSRSRDQLRRFIMHDCSYTSSHHRCNFGLGTQIPAAQLAHSLQRLRDFNDKAIPYRLLPELLPDINYWDSFLGLPGDKKMS